MIFNGILMRLLITGCNGQVGTSLTNMLSERGDVDVLAVSRKHLDITNEYAVNAMVYEFCPDVIINAAAYTAVDRAEEEEEFSYAINRDGPKFLAQAANKVNATIIHLSTDYVFDGTKGGSYNEEDLTNPQNVYGQSKLEGEQAVANACSKHIILRTAWVFSEYGNNFVKTMLRLGASRAELSVVGDQFGGPTYAGDIANAIMHIADCIKQREQVEFGIYNYSGLPHVSWFDFAQFIFDTAIGNSGISKAPNLIRITSSQFPTPAKRPSNSRLSTDKITNTFLVGACDWKAALGNIKAYMD